MSPVPNLVYGNEATCLALELRCFRVALHYMLTELFVGGTLEAAVTTVPVDISLAHILVGSKVFLSEERLPAAGATILSNLPVLLHHVHHQIMLPYKWHVAEVADDRVTV